MRVRRALLVILIVFLIYAVLNDPTQSAGVVGNAWDEIKGGIGSIGEFFDALMAS